jgi:Asp-tRNA(Asn)/Glu-tRNA(Gln) amidotransferase A subunit family amidase
MPSAIDIAAQVRSGARTPREVVEESLTSIAAQDSEIGAFQLVDAEGARRAADELADHPDLANLPLAGVPVAIKDNVDVAGHPTRHGSGATSADPVAADDLLVRRLKEAGAIVVGKTRLPELAIWGFTESVAQGGTRNPRQPARNAGGSTGGGAAAVAAGMVPLALGSDGGGSLRIPTANCGVIGLKPARGSVPLAGGLGDHWYEKWLAGIAEEVERLGLPLDRLEARTRGMATRGERLRRAGKPSAEPGEKWRRTALDWFAEVDVLLSPVIAQPAPPMGWGTRTGYWRAYLNGARTTPYTQAWNVAGFPAMSLPLGGGPATEPWSVQLVTIPGREASLIALAADLERLSTSD